MRMLAGACLAVFLAACSGGAATPADVGGDTGGEVASDVLADTPAEAAPGDDTIRDTTPGDVAGIDAEPDAVAPAELPAGDAEPGDVAGIDPAADPAGPEDDVAADTPAEAPAVSDACAALKEGFNQNFPVGALKRSFMLNLPKGATDARGSWAVLFNWHGYGDSASNMAGLFRPYVNTAGFPFILVTPESTGDQAIEWDMLQVDDAATNQEAQLFDAIMTCLDARFGVDPDRVYSAGFSAGAVMSDLLAVLRGDRLAAVVAWSGGYLDDPANQTGFNAYWPDYTVTNPYYQVVLTGGPNDWWGMSGGGFQIHFDQFAAADVPFLNAHGHDVVYCIHTRGHDVPPEFQGAQAVEFFNAHPRASVASPFAAALPGDYPRYCTFKARDAAQ